LALGALLSGCGGAGSASSSASKPTSKEAPAAASAPAGADPAGNPSEVLARVSGKAISAGELEHALTVEAANSDRELPQPPAYAACVKRLRTSASTSAAQLKGRCAAEHEELLGHVLGSLIRARWLEGEAAEQGVRVSDADIQREYEADVKGLDLQKILSSTKQSVADLKQGLRVGQLSNLLYKNIDKQTPKATHARLLRYYQAHKAEYALPPERDLEIVRTASEASAKKALAEVKAGQSFSEVAKKVSLPQPIGSHEALVRGLSFKQYSEPVLARAIFAAPVGALSGPVKISLGYYVFKVLRKVAPHQQTLAEVQGELAAELPELLHRQTLAAAVKAFKAKWVARTDCRSGYVVKGCKQYKAAKKPAVPEDPYTL
jgi:parvulin-like peptidyl-prolyl isomerase